MNRARRASLAVAAAAVGLLVAAGTASGGTVTKVYSSGDLSLPIGPPSDVPNYYTINTNSDIDVPDVGTVVGAKVSIRLDYPVDSELDISILDPDGSDTLVTLASGAGGSGANFGSGTGCSGTFTVFEDAAATPIASGSAPFAGAFKPAEPLSALIGKPASGRWTLLILDIFPPTTGTLLCWQLELTIETPEAPVTEADVRLRSAGPASVKAGKQLTYTFTVTNRGPGSTTGVTFVDRLPRTAGFVGARTSRGTCARTGRRVRCELGDLAPGASARVTITLRAPAKPGRLSSVASVRASERDPAPENNGLSLQTLVKE
jgi:uncharacterized repeat protein (TIGR01451 family)